MRCSLLIALITFTSAGYSAEDVKVKVKNTKGATAFSVKMREDGSKMVDASEKELARCRSSDGKVKVKDPDEKTLGYVIESEGRVKIEDASQAKKLFELQAQPDGDWKLKDATEKMLYRIKKRDYGYEIEDAKDQRVYKVKVDGDKTSLRNAQEVTVFYTKDPISPLAFACLGFDAIKDLRMRVGLLTSIEQQAWVKAK